ncbi:type III secretion system chaperone family protein [Sansalvadorimonas verongulae]|uniref:hypothetical protein n=1 Tax=Sansalvadorimonas verongulae TaxID=2172824 RepID=UPI0012BD47FE|nr:hypothetical protein [Sansalvadorimonas verongulae]MTI14154.1 hypothetical protein [Sansalvadorimonas verongulae]
MRDLVESAVKNFNRTLGIGELPFPDTGIMQYTFGQGGTFFIELHEKGVLMHLLREIPDHSLDEAGPKALELCHYNQSRKFDTQCALKDGNQLVFITFMTVEKLNGPEIENVLQHLMKLQDSLLPS